MHRETHLTISLKTLKENPATFRQLLIDKKLGIDDAPVDGAAKLVLMADTLIGKQFI